MRTLILLMFLWKSNYGNKIFQRLFATIFSCFFIFFVISFSEIALGSSDDISGPVTGTLTVSLAGMVETVNGFDVFYLDDDNVLHSQGDIICPTSIPSVKYYMVSPNTYCISSPISCSLLGVSVTINSSCITFSDTDNSFTITQSATTPIGTATANGTGYRINSTVIPINTPIVALSGAEDSYQIFSIDVPVGTSKINLNTSEGSGDCDIALVNSQPPFSLFTSEGDFTDENIVVSNPSSGTWYIALYGYTSFSGVTLTTTATQTVVSTSPTPDIKANGSDMPITLGTSDTLSVNVRLAAGSSLGVGCDWWVVASTPFGWYYFDASTMSWEYAGASHTDLSPTYQESLFDLSTFEVLNIFGLTGGTYTFYFAVDTNMNGSIDTGELFFDSVVVNITP